MLNTNNPGLGYIYYGDSTDLQGGYQRLDIYLCRAPSHQHYDPVDARLPIIVAHGIDHLHIRHPFHGSDHYQISAGRLILTDWRGKEVEAFSFGGRLEIVGHGGYTLCSIRSEAPIIPLESASLLRLHHHHATGLAERAEGLIARARAASAHHRASFDEQLAAITPLELYCAVISALEAEFGLASSASGTEPVSFRLYLHDLRHCLIEAQRWIDPRPFFSSAAL